MKAFQRTLEASPMISGPIAPGGRIVHPTEVGLRQAASRSGAEILPTSPLARYELARVKRVQGQLNAAVNDLERVVRDERRWIPPHVELAALYYRLKRPEDGARERQIVDRLAEDQQRQ